MDRKVLKSRRANKWYYDHSIFSYVMMIIIYIWEEKKTNEEIYTQIDVIWKIPKRKLDYRLEKMFIWKLHAIDIVMIQAIQIFDICAH